MSRLSSLTEALLDAAKKAGAEAADAMALSGTSQSIDIRAGALEQAERSEDVEIGLRVLIGGQQACVSASDTSPATLARPSRIASASASWPAVGRNVGISVVAAFIALFSSSRPGLVCHETGLAQIAT